jgi:Holliday junction resolvase RusA-like endonuclease
VAEVSFTVHGTPAPQGSKRHVGNGVMVESSKKVKPWRQDVKSAAEKAFEDRFPMGVTGAAVGLEIEFRFTRPKSHYRTGKNAGILRDSAPLHPAVRPDIDKTTRAVLDALKSVAIKDDAQVTDLNVTKRYARYGQQPGATVTVREIWEQEP